MGFLKRTMSSVSLKGADRKETKQSLASPPPPPVPTLSLGEKQLALDNKLDVAMPDLRFSRLDLEEHVQAIGQDKRQSGASLEPFSPKTEQRKSRLGFFGGRSAMASSEELAPAQKANRASALLGSPQMATPSRSTSAQNFQAPKVDKQQAPKTAHNTMPRSSTAGQALYANGQMSPPPNSSPKPVVVDKKQQKKDEKLRLQQEKEKMKQLAKEMKEHDKLAKRASKLSLKASKSDLKSTQQPTSPLVQSPHRSEKSPKRVEQQRLLQATIPPVPRTPEHRNIHSHTSPQVQHRSSPNPNQQTPVQQAPRTPSYQAPRTPSQQFPSTPTYQTPRTPSQQAPRTSSQSAPRTPTQPLVVVKKQSPVKVVEAYDPIRFPNPHDVKPTSPQRKESQSEESSRGLSNSDSFTHPQAMLPSRTFSSDVPANSKVLMTTSSSEGGTGSSSTADERRRSSESNTSVEYGNNSTYGSDEQFTDAANSIPPSQSGGRPTRDTEREELVQSRLSMTLDGELQHSTEVNYEKPAGTDKTTIPSTTTSQAPKLPAISTDLKANAAESKHVHKRVDSNASTFSAMLMASRPGGSADRAVDAKPAVQSAQKQQIEQYRAGINKSLLARSGLMKQDNFTQEPEEIDQTESKGQQPLSMLDHASSILKRVREAVPNMPQRQRTVQPELVAKGDGWSCMGVGDVEKVDSHWHTVIETIKVAHLKEKEANSEEEQGDEESSEKGEKEASEPEYEYVDEEVEAHYNDLFQLIFTATTPDVMSTLLSYLDIHDIKALRQTSAPVRLAVGANREMILNQFLSGIGYRTWSYVKGSATAARARMAGQSPITTNKDPCPLSLADLEGYIIAQDLLPEYAMVGQEFARAPEEMDQGMARLARATTRAHNRVLTRLRLQPTYRMPSKKGSYASSSSPSSPSTPTSRINSSTSFINRQMSGSVSTNVINRHNSYYDLRKQSLPLDTSELPPVPSLNLINEGLSPAPSSVGSHSPLSPGSPALTTAPSTPSPLCDSSPIETVTAPTLVSPWKPGRAATFRVWVPAKDPSGWLSDAELADCEQELYKSGVWQYLKRGDIVWDTAVGDKLNEGKYVFDGNYLRDLSYAFDVAGHLPSWLNVIMFSPSYWHNVIKSTQPQPVVFLDIAPWKDQILNSLRLVQDHVDTFSGNGARYRIAKWLYRSAANVTSGQIISRMNGGLEIVDDQWAGRIVIEMDGMAEWAKELVNRCAGPDATAREKSNLLATVMGDANEAGKMSNTHDTNGGTQKPSLYNKFGGQGGSTMIRKNVEPQNAPWAIMRERCRPGLIWIRPLGDREKVFA